MGVVGAGRVLGEQQGLAAGADQHDQDVNRVQTLETEEEIKF